ncbi:uncharacterized protein [Nicotiana sylvestris]|uniref:uncharacterized protein n=1 Tax=Nicotiana sylvestris TaxID=4096 RepID=UPI00388CE2A3
MARELEMDISYQQVVSITRRVKGMHAREREEREAKRSRESGHFSGARTPVAARETLSSPVYVSTPAGDSLVVDRVYRSCLVTIRGFETREDLLLLDMVDFDIILGMDWLSPQYVILDCHAKTVTLAMPGIPRIEWSGTFDHTPSRVISFLKAQHMVEKGCAAYFAYVRDVSTDTPSVDSVPVVRDFPDVFPANLPGMSPDRDIDFGIDLLLGTQPISIPPYRMTPPKLKELKDQLQELLDKGFI